MIVETSSGHLDGMHREGHAAFLGVPFAAAPVGAARFAPPRPPGEWTGIRSARSFGAISFQPDPPMGMNVASGCETQAEDCLSLNVFTPAADNQKRPVLCWIHGGAFAIGSSSAPIYDGGALVERGNVVVVTINYRLGALGFADLTGLVEGATANAGLLDQVAALKWIRDNIAQFGGDPDEVTIFGESAGSMSASALLAMPNARGLFRRAILQSGVCRGRTSQQSRATTEKLLRLLSIPTDHAKAILEIPPEKILAAQVAIAHEDPYALTPVADGVVLPASPADLIAGGSASDVDLMLGSTRDEAKLFNAMADRGELPDVALPGALRALLPTASDNELQSVAVAYRQERSDRGLSTDSWDVVDGVQSDIMFRVPNLRLAAAQSRWRKPYVYLFTFESPTVPQLGSCHSLDIPFVFGTLDRFPLASPTDAAKTLCGRMMDAWLAFARTGCPDHVGIPPWTPFEPDQAQTMIFGNVVELEMAPFRKAVSLVEPHLKGVGI